jgi:hypothetical protein
MPCRFILEKAMNHMHKASAMRLGQAQQIRSVSRSEQSRFAAAMTMAFSADPAARWAWPDPHQFLEVFRPLVTLFGGKAFDYGSAYVAGDYFGAARSTSRRRTDCRTF